MSSGPPADVIVPVYLPAMTGLLNFVALDGLWGAVLAPPPRWRAARKPRAVAWKPVPRPARVVWGKED